MFITLSFCSYVVEFMYTSAVVSDQCLMSCSDLRGLSKGLLN